MARQLPFVVQPNKKPVLKKIGTAESGQIEIEARGYVTVGEKAMVDQSVQSVAVIAFQSTLIGIAQVEGKTPEEVYEDFSTTPAPEYLEAWTEELQEAVNALSIESAKRNIVQATALLVSRVDSEWTIQDTMELHGDLVAGLSELYVKESNASIDDIAGDDSTGGAEGKK